MSVTDAIKQSQYRDCVTHACPAAGCGDSVKKDRASFSLKDAPAPHVLVDCDKPPIKQHATRCDYIFAADSAGGCVAPVEMTSGRKSIRVVVEQLQAGADLVASFASQGLKLYFVPVFVGRINDRNQRGQSGFRRRTNQIKFRGQWHPVKYLPNGSKLADAL